MVLNRFQNTAFNQRFKGVTVKGKYKKKYYKNVVLSVAKQHMFLAVRSTDKPSVTDVKGVEHYYKRAKANV